MTKTLLIAAAALALLAAAPVRAQAPAAPPMKTFTSSADVQAIIAQARKMHKDEPTLPLPLLVLAPYHANVEYRTSVGPAAVHETEDELFYVIQGSGTLVTGGKLTKETRLNPANLSGTGIEGGVSRAVATGDFIIVPAGVPHWYNDIKGELVLMSMHVPK